MTKKIIINLIFISLTCSVWAQSLKVKYIKGNISEKTSAVKEAGGEDSVWLSNEAIDFVIANKSFLNNDRDLDGLAVAAILSLPADYVASSNIEYKNQISDKLLNIFDLFKDSSTVRIAVLTKVLSLKNYIPTQGFTAVLNDFIAGVNFSKIDSSLLKSVIHSLASIGNSTSFLLQFNLLGNKDAVLYENDLKQTVQALVPNHMDEAIKIVYCKNPSKINTLFALVKNNPEISKQNLCEIAENVLSEAILFNADSSDVKIITSLQQDSFAILSANKWTRASSVCLSYFDIAKNEYQNGIINENQFITVIQNLNNIAVLDAVTSISKYLGELNNLYEADNSVSQNVVLAVIKTLGAIGDKSAFDSLLAVTYINYPETIKSAAREALAGLKW